MRAPNHIVKIEGIALFHNLMTEGVFCFFHMQTSLLLLLLRDARWVQRPAPVNPAHMWRGFNTTIWHAAHATLSMPLYSNHRRAGICSNSNPAKSPAWRSH